MQGLQDRRIWFGGGAVAAFLIIAVSWFMFVGPERSTASDLRAQAAATQQQNLALQTKVASLEAKSTKIGLYRTSLKAALAALPFDSGLPAFTRELSTLGTRNRVNIGSIVVGGVMSVASVSGGSVPPGTDSTNGGQAAPSTEATPSAGATAPSTAATAAGGMFSVQVTVVSNGTLDHQLEFLDDIRVDGPRRALVTSAQITPGVGPNDSGIDSTSSFTTQLTIFSAPQTQAQIALLKKLLTGKLGD